MKQAYITPDVLVHGTVQNITAASLDSDRQDRIFNAQGVLTGNATGSLDQCFFVPGTDECIIAPGQG